MGPAKSEGGGAGDDSLVARCHLLANRLYFSYYYSILYLVMILLNVAVIIWMLLMPGGYDGSLSFLLLQVLVNLVLVVEVAIRLVSQQGRFFEKWENVFDMCVMALAIIAQILYIHPPHVAAAAVTSEEWADIGATVLRIFRDSMLFARLYIFLKNRSKNQLETTVDFSSIADERFPLLSRA